MLRRDMGEFRCQMFSTLGAWTETHRVHVMPVFLYEERK